MKEKCPMNCSGFKSKTECFDEFRYQYMLWVKSKDKKDWSSFIALCVEHLLLPSDVSMDWLRGLTGR